MKNLKEYIKESILGNWNTVDADKIADKIIAKQIRERRANIKAFLKKSYKNYRALIISDRPNGDDLFEVTALDDVVFNNNGGTSTTNGDFIFVSIPGGFYCCNTKIKSFEGLPKEIGGNFNCSFSFVTSLEGVPEKTGMGFHCYSCTRLTSLEGAPKEVGGEFDCTKCYDLKSLKGAPEKVGGNFRCEGCGKQFTEEDVKKVSDVMGEIII